MSNAKSKLFSERRVFWSLLVLLTIVHACGKDPIPDEPQPDTPPPTPIVNTKPEITSFSPARGAPGTEVTITGKNFKDNVLQNYVRFSGAIYEAFINQATTTELKVKVPEDAVTGKLIVKVGNLSDTTDTEFIVDPAVTAITDFSPNKGHLVPRLPLREPCLAIPSK
ncbi:IPT/TIG domain-containing protein [Paraflavitalea speifideaquila]|uniref:IPT/TIG domain-containing protein n=1 Tax=Paraflavitalea speifideaquila TaxID=3076558 RepID=UPI0028E421BE|nr:IPT/TIG domain-containing protein [Paraflavitalea speifideiaquila]